MHVLPESAAGSLAPAVIVVAALRMTAQVPVAAAGSSKPLVVAVVERFVTAVTAADPVPDVSPVLFLVAVAAAVSLHWLTSVTPEAAVRGTAVLAAAAVAAHQATDAAALAHVEAACQAVGDDPAAYHLGKLHDHH